MKHFPVFESGLNKEIFLKSGLVVKWRKIQTYSIVFVPGFVFNADHEQRGHSALYLNKGVSFACEAFCLMSRWVW